MNLQLFETSFGFEGNQVWRVRLRVLGEELGKEWVEIERGVKKLG